MNQEYTVDLTQTEANFINTLMPRQNSLQIFQKAERRRKAEKKLDDMYVAEFSLRPVRKNKKELQEQNEKLDKVLEASAKVQNTEQHGGGAQNDKNSQVLKQGFTKGKDSNEKGELNPTSGQKEAQIFQPHTSRSQRVSKPTVAYLQFQEETFKKKVPERPQVKALQRNAQNPVPQSSKLQEQELVKRQQRRDEVKQRGLQKQSSVGFKESKELKQPKLSKQVKQQKQKQPNLFLGEQKHQQTKNKGAKQLSINQQKPQKDEKQQSVEKSQKIPDNSKRSNDLAVLEHQAQCKGRNLLEVYFQKKNNNEEKQKLLQNSQQPAMPRPKFVIKSQTVNEKSLTNVQSNNSAKNFQKSQDSVQNSFAKRCWGILQKLKIHKSSWPFRQPVDPQAQGVPDYFEKIKSPMDLKTIQKKLRGEKYKSSEEFESDITLMLQNSYQYNAPTTKYYKLTQQIEEYFKQLKGRKELLSKSIVRNGIQKDGEQSEYEDGEENEERQRLDKGKRVFSESESGMGVHVSSRKLVKVFVTSEGSVRKEKGVTGTENEINKANLNGDGEKGARSNLQSKENTQAPFPTKSAQVREIQDKKLSSNKKQFKAIKIEPIKKQVAQDQQKNAINNNGQKANQPSLSSSSRFGYHDNKISLIQRETLIYDILHIEQPNVRNQLEAFFNANKEVFEKFKYMGGVKKTELKYQQQMQDEQQQMEDESESYEIELRDLDQDSYKILRKQVDRLIQLDRKSIQKQEQDNIMQDQGQILMKD